MPNRRRGVELKNTVVFIRRVHAVHRFCHTRYRLFLFPSKQTHIFTCLVVFIFFISGFRSGSCFWPEQITHTPFLGCKIEPVNWSARKRFDKRCALLNRPQMSASMWIGLGPEAVFRKLSKLDYVRMKVHL